MPLPGIPGRCSASQASRSAWSAQRNASRRSESRASGPRKTDASVAQLARHVRHHAVVGGGGGAQHRARRRSVGSSRPIRR